MGNIIKLSDVSTSVTTDTLTVDLSPYFGKILRGMIHINFDGSTGAITTFKIKPNGKDIGNPSANFRTEGANYTDFMCALDETLNGTLFATGLGYSQNFTFNCKFITSLAFEFLIGTARVCTMDVYLEVAE